MAGKNILTEYYSISDTNIKAPQISRKNDRVIQNSKVMYHCIKSSIPCDIKDTIFTQFNNIQENEEGIALFKHLTTLTTVYLLQLYLLFLTTS